MPHTLKSEEQNMQNSIKNNCAKFEVNLSNSFENILTLVWCMLANAILRKSKVKFEMIKY